MPVMDGFEVATKIRLSNILKDIPILLLTGWDKDYIEENSKNNIGLKIDGYIQKPVNVDIIKALVKNILSRDRN